jgi:alkyldihydroxyacetonephosphate synthase
MTDQHLLTGLIARFGPDRVSTASPDLAAHSHDVWPLSTKQAMQGKHPHAPEAVVRARDTDEVAQVLSWANTHGVPVTPWGLGSSVTGAPLPLHGGVVLDLSQLLAEPELDETDLTVTVAAGARGDRLEGWLTERGYTLGHSPQSLDRSTAAGWLATRATGQFSSKYGGIEDLVVAFTVVLADGTVVHTADHPRAAIGPDLRHLFIGSEGTLGVITAVKLKVFPVPEHRVLQAVRFDAVEAGLATMRELTRAGLRLSIVRFYDHDEARHAMVDSGFEGTVLFLGSEGPRAVAQAEQAEALRIAAANGGTELGPAPVEAWMARRYDFSTIERLIEEPGGYAETIEIAHYWSGIGDVHAAAKKALEPLADEVLGHFSHVYPQGTSLYLILLGRAADDAEAEQRIERIWATAMEVTLAHGAALSHHHGVGIARLPYVRAALGDSALVLDRVKSALDPNTVLNPGKLGLGD